MAYIATSDITDTVVAGFVSRTDSRLTTWMTRTTNEIDTLAELCDVDPDDICWSGSATNSGTIHPKIAEYARTYYCLQVCEDNIGANNVDTAADEKYRVKAQLFADKLNSLRGQITPEMFAQGDEDLSAEDHVGQVGLLWRS